MDSVKSLTLSIFISVVCILGTAQAQQPALRFKSLVDQNGHPVVCRVVDTRPGNGPNGPLAGPAIGADGSRDFPILTSPCMSKVPTTVAAYSLNLSVSPWGILGYATIYPTGEAPPNASTLNSLDGRIKANAAIVPAGPNGSVSVWATDTTDVWLDVNGYFVPAGQDSTALAYFPLQGGPCRVVDTRVPQGTNDLLHGPWLQPQTYRSFPLLSSTNCTLPTDGSAQAYSLNATVVPWSTLGYLQLYPTGQTGVNTSTLNATDGPLLSANDQNIQALTANAAIVPAGTGGAITAFVTDNTDLILDINGYFGPQKSASDLSLYLLPPSAQPPCRVLDTRQTTNGGFLSPPPLTVDSTASPCGVIPEAQAVVLNATVIPWNQLGYLELWPYGDLAPNPPVSTLNALQKKNAMGQELITSNMAIAPTSTSVPSSGSSGEINFYATDPTQLVLDASGYFAPGTAPAPATYLLTVALSGTGTGIVTSLDNKINCGAVCAVSYESGTGVILTVSPAAGNTFVGWSGGGCGGTGSCSLSLTAATKVTATFSGPVISLNSTSVGGNLESQAAVSLSLAAPTGGVTLTFQSSDPTKLLLLPATANPTTAGFASFTANIPAGQGTVGNCPLACGFWIQALASSGSATITVSATGYQSAVATVTLTPSGFQLSAAGSGAGVNFTSTLGGPATPLTVSAVQLDTSGNVLSTSQAVRGGPAVSVTVNSGTPATGTINGSPAVVQPGTTISTNAVSFQPVALGTSLLSISQPAGFLAPATGTQLTATVVSPTITLNPVNVGFNMQAQAVGQLTVAPSSPLNVTITSPDATKVLLSTNPTVAGTNVGGISQISVQVPAGTTALPIFYVQSLVSSGSVTLTASAPAPYTGGTGTVVLTGSAFLLSGPNGVGVNFNTTTISSPTGLTVAIWQLDLSSRPLAAGTLRPGILQQSVTVSSGTQTTGTIVGSPALFNGGDSSNTTLSFQPANCASTPCQTVLSVTQPTFYSAPTSGGTLIVTVDHPSVMLRMNVTTIGNNLEVLASGALDAPAPSGGLSITITTPTSSKVLLSACGQASGCTAPATSLGSHSITITVPQGSGVNSLGFPTFYVQAQDKTGTVQLTATAPAPFKTATISVTLAPSGFVIDGGNGVGQNIGLSAGKTVNLTVSAYVLNPTSTPPLAPTQLPEALASGTASVTVTSNSGAAVISGSPVVISAGNISGTATVHGQSLGTATVTAAKPSTPAGFDTPSSGNHLNVVVQ